MRHYEIVLLIHPDQSEQVPAMLDRYKALVAQGGGPTAVINQSMVGVVLEARKYAQVIRVYGAQNGVRGIINEDFIDLTLTVQVQENLVAEDERRSKRVRAHLFFGGQGITVLDLRPKFS